MKHNRLTLALPLVAAAFLVTLAMLLGIRQVSAQTAASVAVDLDPAAATGIRIEGLVADANGRLYTSDLDSRRLWRYTPSTNQLETLGTLPSPATGMAFDASGNLYFASGASILKINAADLAGSSIAPTAVMTFATGVTGANGLAFDARTGNLYVSGAATGNIYVVASSGVTSTWATGFTSSREDQRISTNGLQFGPDGLLYSANTGTGAIDRIAINADGSAGAPQRWVTDPLLLGADGIVFASNGDLYVAANERNAVVRVTPAGQVSEVAANGNNGPLEFPASPAFSGNSLYLSNFDIERGANAPNAGGVGGSIAVINVGVGGLALPAASQVSGGAPPPAAPTALGTATPLPPTPPPPGPTAIGTATPFPATPVPTVEVPTATPTPAAGGAALPGVPRTGGGDSGWVLLVGLVCAVAAIAIGVGTRRAAVKR